MRTALDPGGAVAEDVIEFVAQVVDHFFDAFAGEGVFVARLRGRQDREVLQPPVHDQSLFDLGVALDDVDEVEHHAALASHHHIEIAQADIEIDDDGLLAAHGKSCAERRGRSRLADSTLTRCDYYDFGHSIPLCWLGIRSISGARRAAFRYRGTPGRAGCLATGRWRR